MKLIKFDDVYINPEAVACVHAGQDGETMIELIGVESRYIITPIPAETVVTMLLDNKKKTKRHKVKGKLK